MNDDIKYLLNIIKYLTFTLVFKCKRLKLFTIDVDIYFEFNIITLIQN